MPNPAEGLEVYENMVDVLLVLEMFLIEDSQVEDLLCGAPSCSEACLFFSNDLCLRLRSVQYNLQHDFARVKKPPHWCKQMFTTIGMNSNVTCRVVALLLLVFGFILFVCPSCRMTP